MSIPYAPLIADTIPGFTTTKIEIPFEHNPAIGPDIYNEYSIKFQRYEDPDNWFIIDGCYEENGKIVYEDQANGIKNIEAKTYYKIQVRYGNENDNNVFSNVSVGRCCIAGEARLNIVYPFILQSHYEINENDLTEKPYYYHFAFYKEDNDITPYKTTEQFLFKQNNNNEYFLNIMPEATYYISCIITTINGLIVESKKEKMAVKALNTDTTIIKEMNIVSNGDTADIILTVNNEQQANIILTRYNCNTGIYEILKTGILNTGTYNYRDCSLEQGVNYNYILFYNNEYKKEISDIMVNFDDIILSDEEKTLRIKYNPKVSSFKYTILEQKTDTIGGKYPFFFRNGNTKYAEIPISGLISYLSDENEEFVSAINLGLNDDKERYKTTSLEDYNFTAERRFKLAVLEWLNNGKPKLFRSPAEGNYIIRLMNVSLTPMEQLGRLLHSFSATGYEIAEYTYEELYNRNLLLKEVSSNDND